jgi:DNA-binding NarL/FixJ family response regulator
MLKIIIADDNDTFRKGLVFYIEQILGHTIIGEAGDGKQLIELPNLNQADVLLIDIEMPQLDGIETTKKLNWMFRTVRTIAITADSEKAYLTQLIGAGFNGFVAKKDIFNDLPNALECVMKDDYFFKSKDITSMSE